MIEAMARGLVCIGSDAGGIPELLPRDALVPRGNAMALADKLAEVIIDGDRMHRMSARNLETATGFRAAALQQRRIGFYRRLRAITEAWVRDHTSG
jgi:glycosyltransferase involved in cell wall biosynthesis